MSLKSVRKAVRSFLGVKKKPTEAKTSNTLPVSSTSNLRENRRRFGSESFLAEPQQRGSQRSLPRRSHSSVEGFRPSTLPRATRERIEEWNRNACPENASSREGSVGRRTVSGSSRRSGSMLRSSQSMSAFDSRYRSGRVDADQWQDELPVNPRDSKRNSGSFLYINEGITDSGSIDQVSSTRSLPSPAPLNREVLMRDARSLPMRGSSFSTSRPNDPRSRTISHTSMASERLVSCMEKLEKMSRQLNEATKTSKSIEQFRQVSETLGPAVLPRSHSQECLPSTESKKPQPKRETLPPSFPSVITRGEVPETETLGSSNRINPPSRPRGSNTLPSRRPPVDWNFNARNPRLVDKHQQHLRSDSLSSGYSSASGGSPSSRNRPSRDEDERSMMSVEGSFSSQGYPRQTLMYPSEPHYQDEGVYGYGSYGYPSSSIYEDEMQQQNGWFYLPAHQQAKAYPYYPTGEMNHFQNFHQSQQYPQITAYPMQYPIQYPAMDLSRLAPQPYPLQHYPAVDYNGQWGSHKYGGLSDSFLDPAAPESPLAAAISSTRVPSQDFSYEGSDSAKSDWKKYGSFRYRNGEKTVLPSDSRRRKTVRFSQTVKQRIETDASEMKDSTSMMKGSHEEEEEEQYDAPTAWKTAVSDGAVAECSRNSLAEPIYEFPSGHIENSCMCSDCILARQSCQLQATTSYAYY